MRMEAFTNETQQTILYLNIVYRQFHMYMYFQTIKKNKTKTQRRENNFLQES